MIWILNRFKGEVKSLAVIISTIVILGCGGGGEEAVSGVPSAVIIEDLETEVVSIDIQKNDYMPDSTKLSTTAKSSVELYVEPNFDFINYKEVFFNVSVTNSEGEPKANKLLLISSINSEIEVYDDPRLQDKSFLAMTKTNSDGQAHLTLEVPQDVSNILLELNVVGIENDVILPLDSNETINYQFKQIR